jgi:hypothetical protein
MFLRSLATAACCTLLATASFAEMNGQMDKPAGQVLPSPAATADVTLAGKAIKITYNAPSMRGRKIMGGLVPYGEVWRTGANPATTLITTTNLKIGTLDVPAGTYSLYTLPSASQWLLIVNKQTGQWGTVYKQDQDLGRTPMQSKTLSAPQEKMSITFEHTSGNTTELHIKWETTDEYVTVKAE